MSNRTIVVVAMIKNEADIIEAFIRHALTYADAIIITNHNSTDRSYDIIQALILEGLPIEVFNYYDSAYIQSEITTKMMHIAIDKYNADIVIPLDADEFLMSKNSLSVRKILDIMPLNQIWGLEWIDHYIADEQCSDNIFILNKNCVREKMPSEKSKVIIGGEIARLDGSVILSGNHGMGIRKSDENSVTINESFSRDKVDLYVAHFPARSIIQYASKVSIGFINQTSLNGSFISYDNAWTRGYKALLQGKLTLPEAKDPIYVGKIVLKDIKLKYTKDSEINLISRILIESEKLANELAVKNLIIAEKTVYYILIMSNDFIGSCKTVESVIRQCYPKKSIFCLDMSFGAYEHIYDKIQQNIFSDNDIWNEYISLTDIDDFLEVISHIKNIVGNNYIEFLEPGNILHNDACKKMLLTIDRYDECIAVYTNRLHDYRENIGKISEESVAYIMGYNIVKQLQENKVILSGGISGFLFRASVLEKRDSLLAYLQKEVPLENSFIADVLANDLFIAMNEDLLDYHDYSNMWQKKVLGMSPK